MPFKVWVITGVELNSAMRRENVGALGTPSRNPQMALRFGSFRRRFRSPSTVAILKEVPGEEGPHDRLILVGCPPRAFRTIAMFGFAASISLCMERKHRG